MSLSVTPIRPIPGYQEKSLPFSTARSPAIAIAIVEDPPLMSFIVSWLLEALAEENGGESKDLHQYRDLGRIFSLLGETCWGLGWGLQKGLN